VPARRGLAPVSDLHDRPTAAELVAAVRDLLDGSVRDETSGAVQYQVRVAGNVLRIVERELAAAGDQLPRHAQLLTGLDVADERALAAAIRAGDLDDRLAEVVAAVEETVRMRLAVDHPGYETER
jgi:hypothetical protein